MSSPGLCGSLLVLDEALPSYWYANTGPGYLECRYFGLLSKSRRSPR
jgi:hypothetical protein